MPGGDFRPWTRGKQNRHNVARGRFNLWNSLFTRTLGSSCSTPSFASNERGERGGMNLWISNLSSISFTWCTVATHLEATAKQESLSRTSQAHDHSESENIRRATRSPMA